MAILVCGGAGYIGSHTCVELIKDGYEIIVADNLSNSSREALNRVEYITGKDIIFEKVELCNYNETRELFKKYQSIDAVINFAGYKAVGESKKHPLMYYRNNIISTLNILDAMKEFNIYNLIFSSSAAVYGNPNSVPINEEFPIGDTTNPYGTTKVILEQILKDCCFINDKLNIAILRYFNPIGAHESGLIGEDPKDTPNNLVPYISKVAIGELKQLHIYGNDYPTKDGTGVRDYIHVVDLAKGHVAALKKVLDKCGLFICNLGTGKGYSVMEVLHAYEKACKSEIPYVIESRRQGDVAICYADIQKASKELGWRAEYDIEDMCKSSWKWQQMNPNGYKKNK